MESDPQDQWQAEYEFWTKIIGDEVARRRLNEGFEPIDIDLYELTQAKEKRSVYYGKTLICGRNFCATIRQARDINGQKYWKLSIRVEHR